MAQVEDLLVGISKGDAQALSDLYDQLSGVIHALTLRILGDPAVAENTVQKVFLTIWKKASQYDGDRSSAKTWIFSIARNQAIDEWRRLKRHRSNQELDQLKLIDKGSPDPLNHTIEQEQSALVREALESLPAEQRQALLLSYFSGLSHTQIAEHLETPLGTVKTRIQLGLHKLKRKLRPRMTP